MSHRYVWVTKGILSPTRVKQLKDLLDMFVRNKKPNAANLPTLTYGLEYSHIKKMLGDVIQKLIGNAVVQDCNLQRTSNPHSIHSDYSPPASRLPDGNVPHRVVLFPLHANGPAHTIVFKEQSKNPVPADDDPVTGYKFTKEYECILGHTPEYSRQRVSDPIMVEWNPGDAIVWDRRNFHCSDNFIANGTTVKDSLILFTSKDSQ